MKFILPMPPGINRTYGVNLEQNGRMYKKKTVTDWEEDAMYSIILQWKGRREPLKGNVQVGINWFYKVDRDIDAGLKVLLDVFQKANVYKNDGQVRRITHMDIAEDKENPRVEVQIDLME